jgi:hypothetical protein
LSESGRLSVTVATRFAFSTLIVSYLLWSDMANNLRFFRGIHLSAGNAIIAAIRLPRAGPNRLDQAAGGRNSWGRRSGPKARICTENSIRSPTRGERTLIRTQEAYWLARFGPGPFLPSAVHVGGSLRASPAAAGSCIAISASYSRSIQITNQSRLIKF